MDTLIVKPDILIFTETWLTDKHNPSIYLQNYNVFQTARLLKRTKRGGCVLFCTHTYLDCSSLHYLAIAIDDDNEIISIKLKLKNKVKLIIFTGLYRAPNSDTHFLMISFILFFKYINADIFICDDFNIDFLDIF